MDRLLAATLCSGSAFGASQEVNVTRYFFDLVDGQILVDDVGQELPDISAARDEAARILGETVRDDFPGDGPKRDLHVEVRDEAGAKVLTVSVRYNVNPPDFKEKGGSA